MVDINKIKHSFPNSGTARSSFGKMIYEPFTRIVELTDHWASPGGFVNVFRLKRIAQWQNEWLLCVSNHDGDFFFEIYRVQPPRSLTGRIADLLTEGVQPKLAWENASNGR